MAERTNIEEMEVGDHISLRPGPWHSNPDAKTLYEDATAHGAMHGTQFQVEDLPGTRDQPYLSRLVRIR